MHEFCLTCQLLFLITILVSCLAGSWSTLLLLFLLLLSHGRLLLLLLLLDLLLLWRLNATVIESINTGVCTTSNSTCCCCNTLRFWHDHVFRWVNYSAINIIRIMNMLVKSVNILVEIHIILVILHLIFTLRRILFLSTLILILYIRAIVAHPELLLLTLAFILYHHTLVHSWFDLFMHALIKVITWCLSSSLILLKVTSRLWVISNRESTHITLVEDHLTIALTTSLNPLVLILTLFFLIVQWWTFLFDKAALSFVDVNLIIRAWVVLFTHLILLVDVCVLSQSLHVKRSHVLIMSSYSIVCTAVVDHHLFGNVYIIL